MAWRIPSKEAIPALKKRLENEKLDTKKQDYVLTSLAFIPEKSAAETMYSFSNHPDSSLAEMANYWLSFRQGNDWKDFWIGVKLEWIRRKQEN
ncbi:hypothetical protein V8V91_10490 [Algoriphagus halophilus]|uniref:hypothetical protein n=1 Tax=Algoriphagus halophilus TaxID=226505 RepID=UPI00358DE12C